MGLPTRLWPHDPHSTNDVRPAPPTTHQPSNRLVSVTLCLVRRSDVKHLETVGFDILPVHSGGRGPTQAGTSGTLEGPASPVRVGPSKAVPNRVSNSIRRSP